MRKVIFMMQVSLDGFFEGPGSPYRVEPALLAAVLGLPTEPG